MQQHTYTSLDNCLDLEESRQTESRQTESRQTGCLENCRAGIQVCVHINFGAWEVQLNLVTDVQL